MPECQIVVLVVGYTAVVRVRIDSVLLLYDTGTDKMVGLTGGCHTRKHHGKWEST